MTEPETNVPDFPAVSGPAAEDVAQLSRPGAGQMVNPSPPVPGTGESVLATYEPHTFHASSDHVITPSGVAVPAEKVPEYIEAAARFGVPVYEKEV
jgi:hypothetical protein